MLEISEVFNAARVLGAVARHTPIVAAPKLNPEADVWIKSENLQLTGSFKLRGAYYKISQLTDEEKSRGVIACSAGNHAQGVALGATHNGIKSIICLPEGAPISKIEATKGYGAEVCMVPGVYDDAYAKAIELQKEHRYTFVHPFDDEKVIAGQGTIGLEILNDMPDVEAIIVPVGGGGLISGVAFAVKSLNPEVKVYGVQAEGAPSMVKSIKEGKRLHLDQVGTIADGISVKEPGELTYEICQKYVDDIVTVSDEETAAAILALMENNKVVAEGAGAVSAAAAMFNKVPIKGKKVVCIVSGGNIDVNMVNRIIMRGLAKSGRIYNFELSLSDKPGQLEKVCAVVANLGANVMRVNHERVRGASGFNDCLLEIELETRNSAHIDSIRHGLKESGFRVLN